MSPSVRLWAEAVEEIGCLGTWGVCNCECSQEDWEEEKGKLFSVHDHVQGNIPFAVLYHFPFYMSCDRWCLNTQIWRETMRILNPRLGLNSSHPAPESLPSVVMLGYPLPPHWRGTARGHVRRLQWFHKLWMNEWAMPRGYWCDAMCLVYQWVRHGRLSGWCLWFLFKKKKNWERNSV